MDKSWDHPWTTEEMRKKRREWSLAGDAGLLKHLQQFSENLISRADKTEEALASLTNQLHETSIFIDNVNNTSEALANTQFIESRVHDDDVEVEKALEASVQEFKNQDIVAAELIASVGDSIKQGLNIMFEKYKEMEFVDSDSEEEEDNKVILSVVLGPNNPYQDRPLPYVIGSEKWKNSSKIGLESSSSSESEQIDEEESESEIDDTAAFKHFSSKTNVSGLLSPVSENFSKTNDVAYMDSEKMDVVSQNNTEPISESITPNDSVSKMPLSNDTVPNFAAELAKRLGTVRQVQKSSIIDEKSEASINQFKGDLFAPERAENVSIDKSKNVFSETRQSVNDQSSENSWNQKPIKPYKNNIIPASVDVPPPISTISTKPKSAIDDLFADADSEDSDDIFSSKNTIKTIVKNKHSANDNTSTNTETVQNKYLDIVQPTNNIATSTPEIDVNTTNLFSDDEDVGDLFGSSKTQPENKKKPVGGVPILGNVLTSDVESIFSSSISRIKLSGSSGSNAQMNDENSSNNEPMHDSSQNMISNDNVSERDSIVVSSESEYSSGISSQPWSINNTGGSSINIESPQLASTRLKSEEIYRERVASDSLFTAQTRNLINVTSNSSVNQSRVGLNENVPATDQDDVFQNEDLFGPPPLPKADSKLTTSKVSSLFDDSDSGDELFSTTSSGSRSQKSSDFLTSVAQHSDKIKSGAHRKGLFDEEVDIFSNKDPPDVNIFGTASKSLAKEEINVSDSWKRPNTSEKNLFESNVKDTTAKSNAMEKSQGYAVTKRISLFDDDEDINDGDLFATKPARREDINESRIFNNDDSVVGNKNKEKQSNLFSAEKTFDGKQIGDKSFRGTIKSDTNNVNQDVSVGKNDRADKDVFSDNSLFSSSIGSRGLIFEDDDYEDLFSTKSTKNVVKEQIKKENVLSIPEATSDSTVKEISTKDVDRSDESNIFAKAQEPSLFDTASDKIQQRNDKDVHRIPFEERNIMEDVAIESKKSPPKSLDIQAVAPLSSPDENSEATKRTVSGKIKNLMGKMGDLKMLSPMDTPPLWRRSEEKTDEEDNTADRDSDDGGCISIQGHSSSLSVSEDSAAQKQSLQSTISGESNVESAVSFDEPVQIETLSTTASKTRVRIQAKRRPQSRYARKSALRQSGIDFDTVDASESNLQDESHGNPSLNTLNKDPTNVANVNVSHAPSTHSEYLVSDNLHRTTDTNVFLTADDKSELGSLSKESSLSVNKNTLLSPSTDEEDLFDVPPELPEDPQKDDTLFGRAPILSPVEQVASKNVSTTFKPLKDTHIQDTDDIDVDSKKTIRKINRSSTLHEFYNESNAKATVLHTDEKESRRDNSEAKDESKDVIDPLRDSSHDPLKDPSQLFAFVTKTPSPEKGKNLLFTEDDSLFSSGGKKSIEEQVTKKPVLDLFSDDGPDDLFSESLTKPVKKPLKDTKISLFDDEDNGLFGPAVKRSLIKRESVKKQFGKKISLFEDDDDDDDDDDNDTNLFIESSESTQKSDSGSIREHSTKNEIFANTIEPVRTSHITDIFADQSSEETDIFAVKSIPKKVIASKSLFSSDEDDNDSGDIFAKKTTTDTQVKLVQTRSTIKKSVTKDLKKTAEKIEDDPLSILQDD